MQVNSLISCRLKSNTYIIYYLACEKWNFSIFRGCASISWVPYCPPTSPLVQWLKVIYFMHTKPLVSGMPSCDWVGHHHTPVWCADFHSVLRERWEKAGSAMMYDIKSEAQRAALSHQMRRMTVQMKVFHCIKIRLLNKTGGTKFCIHKKENSGRFENPPFFILLSRERMRGK